MREHIDMDAAVVKLFTGLCVNLPRVPSIIPFAKRRADANPMACREDCFLW
jgi:hypothetical protein